MTQETTTSTGRNPNGFPPGPLRFQSPVPDPHPMDENEPSDPRDPLNIRARNLGADILSALIGRWYWVAVPLVLALAGAWYYLSVAPPVYRSTATIMVKVSTKGGPVPDDTRAATELDLRTADAINTIIGKLKLPGLFQTMLEEHPELMQDPELVPRSMVWTPDWMRKNEPQHPVPVIPPPPATPKPPARPASTDDVAATPEPPADPAWVAWKAAVAREAAILAPKIAPSFEVASRRQTRLVDVSVSHTSPRLSRLLAEALIDAYVTEYVERSKTGTISSFDFLKKESDNVRSQMEMAQHAHAAYVTALALDTKLETQEAELSALLVRYRDKHPRVIQSRKQLKETQDAFMVEFEAAQRSGAAADYWKTKQGAGKDAVEKPTAKPPDSTVSLDPAATREQTVREASRQLKSRSKVLESEMESQKANFDNLQAQFSKVDLTQKSENQDAEVLPLDPAREGLLTAPKPALIYAAAGIGGLFFGIGLALLLQRMDNRVHTVADLEDVTGIPVLASVAALRPEVLKRSAGTPGSNELMSAWAPDLFFRDNGAKTVEAEMIRILRTSIILLGPAEAFKTILFTSALPGEGKSFTSANVAASFAMQGTRTLLVDMDLRRPRQHVLFGTDRHKGAGLVDVLAGQCPLPNAIHPSGLANLYILPAGSQAPNPAEILNVERLKQLMAALKGGFERIIIDTAPLLPVSDTRLISRAVDTCILVAGAEKTPKGAIRRGLELLGTTLGGERGARTAGCVLNGTVETRRNLGYNYSYGYYGKGNKYSSYGSVYGDDAEEETAREKRNAKKLKS